jgi:hypothetical protein
MFNMENVNSATFSITTAGGYNVLFTIRENDIKSVSELISLVIAVDKDFTLRGFKPQVKSFGGGFPKKEKEYTGDICPKDGGRLYHMVTKTGKDMCKCENSKYDFTTKTSSGCDYLIWGKNEADAKVKKEAWKRTQTVTQFEQENPNY